MQEIIKQIVIDMTSACSCCTLLLKLRGWSPTYISQSRIPIWYLTARNKRDRISIHLKEEGWAAYQSVDGSRTSGSNQFNSLKHINRLFWLHSLNRWHYWGHTATATNSITMEEKKRQYLQRLSNKSLKTKTKESLGPVPSLKRMQNNVKNQSSLEANRRSRVFGFRK